MRREVIRTVAGLVLVACPLVTMTGCRNPNQTSVHYLRLDPNPGTTTLSSDEDEVQNRINLTHDTNWSAFREDLGRALLTDRPSRLTRVPMK